MALAKLPHFAQVGRAGGRGTGAHFEVRSFIKWPRSEVLIPLQLIRKYVKPKEPSQLSRDGEILVKTLWMTSSVHAPCRESQTRGCNKTLLIRRKGVCIEV